MPKLCLSSLKRGKIVLLLLMLMLLGFLFLMNRERERRIIYQGAAGEEKEAFLARGAYESLEAKRKVKPPKEQGKTAKEKQEPQEDQESPGESKEENGKENTGNGNEESREAIKEESQEESKEESKEDSEEDSKAEIGKNGKRINQGGGVADSREEIQQNRKEEKININTATEQELESLKGIGPATAKNIIRYREEYGGFSSIEEIKNVKRIGDKIFEKIKADICV